MNGQEFATAVQYDLPIIVVVVNNGIYGTIRMHQEREYPGRVVATDLKNPDFAALARAYGGHGETVERTAEFAPAFERARASGKPSIIEVKLDPGGDHPDADAERHPRPAVDEPKCRERRGSAAGRSMLMRPRFSEVLHARSQSAGHLGRHSLPQRSREPRLSDRRGRRSACGQRL